MTEFERALARVLVHEGGYVNHPKDPGGPTNKGVTQRVYDDFRRSRNLTARPVREIADGEIGAIYKTRYWDLFKGDRMPPGVGYVVFDGAVNSGVGQSVKWLQRALAPYYKGAIDGVVGEGTLFAIENHPNHDALIAKICELRMAFLRALKTWPTFGRGWASRVAGVQQVGQAWAGNALPPAVHFVDGGQAKSSVTDVAVAPSQAPGDIATGGGSATAVLTQAIGQLSPLAMTPTIANVVTALTVVSVLVAVGGFIYRAWAKRKAEKLKEAVGA